MGKKKADIVIYGNLICEQKLMGGGKLYLQKNINTLQEFFDIEGACVIHGDLQVDNFNAGDLCVVVCGWAAAKGGGDGEQ